MSEKQKNLIEEFKLAISSTVKSIADLTNLNVVFDSNKNNNNDEVISLPNVEKFTKKSDFYNLRAVADLEALKLKFSDKTIYKKNKTDRFVINLIKNIKFYLIKFHIFCNTAPNNPSDPVS